MGRDLDSPRARPPHAQRDHDDGADRRRPVRRAPDARARGAPQRAHGRRDQGGSASERDLLRRPGRQFGVRGRPARARGGLPVTVIAVLGLGEAGAAIAADLAAAGARVLGWDPARRDPIEGVQAAAGDREAVAGADVVLSVNSGAVALEVAQGVADALGDRHLYADLNTTSPGVKRAVGEAVSARGATFADVALIAPVPGRGARTPTLASGPGAPRFADELGRFGMPVNVLGPEPGEAAARKLVRSVFAKG